jgi:hypothetical protein
MLLGEQLNTMLTSQPSFSQLREPRDLSRRSGAKRFAFAQRRQVPFCEEYYALPDPLWTHGGWQEAADTIGNELWACKCSNFVLPRKHDDVSISRTS